VKYCSLLSITAARASSFEQNPAMKKGDNMSNKAILNGDFMNFI
jgi:hypothetical protein